MATAQNTTVKIYAGVPLIKGGTEVLYLSQGAAESALAGYLKKTYTQYYYTRENRGAIQVEDPIQNVEGANYVVFQNNSHGGKLFFGFIDRLLYINDNCTEIQFTIDPFPTYLSDTTAKTKVFLQRNTVKVDTASNYLAPDYLPESTGQRWVTLGSASWACTHGSCYYACKEPDGNYFIDPSGVQLGVRVAPLTQLLVEYIQQHNGVIIGAYLSPWFRSAGGYDENVVLNLGTISGNAASPLSSLRWNKTKSSVYNSIILRTSQGSKRYQLENFSNTSNIVFGVVGVLFPQPYIYIYPKNYCGITDNLSEGISLSCPALPISASAQYTNLQQFNDSWGIATGALGGAVAGAIKGFSIGGAHGAVAGAALGGVMGASAGLVTMAKNQAAAQFEPPTVSNGSSFPPIATDYTLNAQLQLASPMLIDLNRIDDYFDYFGYNIEAEGTPNLDDGAYIQTGEEFVFGSEADLELNARFMSGIKIKKTL